MGANAPLESCATLAPLFWYVVEESRQRTGGSARDGIIGRADSNDRALESRRVDHQHDDRREYFWFACVDCRSPGEVESGRVFSGLCGHSSHRRVHGRSCLTVPRGRGTIPLRTGGLRTISCDSEWLADLAEPDCRCFRGSKPIYHLSE